MKKVWILSAILMILITCYEIGNTYAKYVAKANGIAKGNVGAWVIKVNDTLISTGTEEQDFTIQELKYASNEYVKEGKIAPGTSGYFDLEIDATEASVAVTYDVELNLDELTENSDSIKISSFTKIADGVETTSGIAKKDENTYTGNISLQDIENGKTTLLRVHIVWEDNEENNEQDSKAGQTANSSFSIPVKVKVSQYQGN